VVWYFAYGSNMQTATLCGRRGIQFHRAQPGLARGWRLVLDKPGLIPTSGSFANIVADPDVDVWGVLYQIAAADIEHIDLTEGVLIGNYARIEVPVWPAGSDAPINAFTLTSGRREPDLQPSTRYMSLLIAGAEEHGLPSDWVAYLRSISTQPETAEATQARGFIDEALLRRK
jgi:gamma-glutamylcyclotransferase